MRPKSADSKRGFEAGYGARDAVQMGRVHFVDDEEEQDAFDQLPYPMRQFLRLDAPMPFDSREILWWVKVFGDQMAWAMLLAGCNGSLGHVYGKEHPQYREYRSLCASLGVNAQDVAAAFKVSQEFRNRT